MEDDLVNNSLEAFNYIYKKHFSRLVKKFNNEDLVNDAFCIWLEKFRNETLKDTDNPGVIYNFIRTVIKNNQTTLYSRDPFMKATTVKEFELIDDTTPEYLLLKKEQTVGINAIINNMPTIRKKQITEFFKTDSIAEIAKITNCNYNTVKANLRIAKQTIKDEFDGYPIDVINNDRILKSTGLDDDLTVNVVRRAFMSLDSKVKTNFTQRRKTVRQIKIKPKYDMYDSDIVNLRTKGNTYFDISTKLKVPFKYVKALCIKHNLSNTKINRTKEHKEAAVILELYNKGLTVTEIEKQTGYKRYLIYECIPRIY